MAPALIGEKTMRGLPYCDLASGILEVEPDFLVCVESYQQFNRLGPRPNVYGVAYECRHRQSHEAEFIERVIFGICLTGSDYESRRGPVKLFAHHREKSVLPYVGLPWSGRISQSASPQLNRLETDCYDLDVLFRSSSL